MKSFFKIIFVGFLLFTVITAFSCNNSSSRAKQGSVQVVSKDTAIISFTEYEHDFGKIAEGEKVACIFTFQNTGKGPLLISSVTTSCGCTVPKYETKPVNPGASGTIEVVFDASGKNGRQTKTISVTSNASKPVVLLRITGEVFNNK
jgi:hypothetical protein